MTKLTVANMPIELTMTMNKFRDMDHIKARDHVDFYWEFHDTNDKACLERSVSYYFETEEDKTMFMMIAS